jgi:hypothetical protein
MKEGDPCDPLRRRDSERILRAQPFIAQATVTAYADGPETVRLEVVTVDEFSPVAAVGFDTESPWITRVKLGSGNINGAGQEFVGTWREGFAYRDTYRGEFIDYQAAGRPVVLRLYASRQGIGGAWDAQLTRPFFSPDVQRTAWQLAGGESREFVTFRRDGAEDPSLVYEREFAVIGTMARVGRGRRLSLFGFSLTREETTPEQSPILVTDSGTVADTSSELIARYSARRAARGNFLWGIRDIRFTTVSGFDALAGVQDVRRGFQLGTLLGRSMPVLGSQDDDIYLGAELFMGWGGQTSYAALEVRGEGRKSFDTDMWDDIRVGGRAAWYLRPHERHTTIASLEYSGGWRSRTPFQLNLGEYRGGLRGFSGADLPGGQRGIVRLEQRVLFPSVRGSADGGVSLFAESGRMWAGDVPYGMKVTPRYVAGASLLAAIPPRSQRLWRVDVAVPINAIGGAGIDVRLTTEDRTRVFWREPNDFARNRERSIPSGVFTWP